MNEAKYTFLLVALAVAALSVGVAGARLVSDGLERVDTKIALTQARQDWQKGRILESLDTYLKAMGMVIEGGVRWQTAQPYVRQFTTFSRQGNLPEALQACTVALQVLGRYDDESAVRHKCYVLDIKLHYATPPTILAPPPRPAPRR